MNFVSSFFISEACLQYKRNQDAIQHQERTHVNNKAAGTKAAGLDHLPDPKPRKYPLKDQKPRIPMSATRLELTQVVHTVWQLRIPTAKLYCRLSAPTG